MRHKEIRMARTEHAETPAPQRGGASSSAPKEALKKEGEPEKKHEAKSAHEREDEKLDKALMESFPGSDPIANTQPTAPEPPAPKKKTPS
jgi:hypothetical protein